jgi:hypothetical protein
MPKADSFLPISSFCEYSFSWWERVIWTDDVGGLQGEEERRGEGTGLFVNHSLDIG